MKKAIAAAAVLLVLLLAWVFAGSRGIDAPFSESFPAGAAGYAALKDGNALLREVRETNFWKSLLEIESVGDLARALRAWEGAGAALSAAMGDETAAAFYGARGDFGPSVLLAARGRGTGNAVRDAVVTRLGGAPCGARGGMELYSFRLAGMRGVCAAGGDAALAAVSSRDPMALLEASLALREGKGKSLRGERGFASGLGAPPRGRGKLVGCAWCDGEGAEALAKAWRSAAGSLGWGGPPAGAAGPAPVLGCGGYLCRDRGLAGRIRVRYDRSRLTGERGEGHFAASGPIGAPGLAPRGTIVMAASRLGGRRGIRALPAGSLVEGWLEACGAGLGAEGIPWAGDEASAQLSAVRTGGLFPLPQAAMIVDARDRRAAERAVRGWMESAARRQAAPGQSAAWEFLRPEMERTVHRGVAVTSLVYPVPGVSPSFAFVGERLVAGLDRASVRGIIDLSAGEGEPLAADPLFREMRGAVPARLTRLVWIDGEGAVRTAEALAGWIAAVRRLTRSVSDEGPSPGEEALDRDMPRLLSCCRVFRAWLGASASRGDAAEEYFVLRLRDLEAPRGGA